MGGNHSEEAIIVIYSQRILYILVALVKTWFRYFSPPRINFFYQARKNYKFLRNGVSVNSYTFRSSSHKTMFRSSAQYENLNLYAAQQQYVTANLKNICTVYHFKAIVCTITLKGENKKKIH